jgi:tripartite-type tricarboxylate transporter receptor subunit TctC
MKVTERSISATAILMACILGLNVALAHAQNQPPLKIIVGFSPGGPTDAGIRIVASEYTKQTGQTVIVENLAGGGGTIAAQVAKRAAGDGRTLWLADSGMCCGEIHAADSGLDPMKDFKPVLSLWSFPMLLAVPASSPVKSISDLVALARSKPDGLAYASQGYGSAGHILGEMFGKAAKIKVLDVPYSGATLADIDVAAGRVDFFFAGYWAIHSFLQKGGIRVIAGVVHKGMSAGPGLESLPTLADAGYPEVTFDVWFALLAPVATPDVIVEQLHTKLARAIQSPAVLPKLNAMNMQIQMNSTVQDLYRRMADQIRVVKPLMDNLGLRPH